MIIDISPKLFRYDLFRPLFEWSQNFNSTETNYFNPLLGYKNKAGLFFFAF